MLRQVASAAAQVRTALRSCAETDLSAFTPDARPRAMVVAGMGGSGLAGELPGPGSDGADRTAAGLGRRRRRGPRRVLLRYHPADAGHGDRGRQARLPA